jgi:quercetin dioxygenase-like cupin family protein
MARIRALGKDALADAAGSPGIARHKAFSGDGFQVVRSRVDPGVISGWHHHGAYGVYGYMLSGTARFEGGPGGREAISVGPGLSSTSPLVRFTGTAIRQRLRVRK